MLVSERSKRATTIYLVRMLAGVCCLHGLLYSGDFAVQGEGFVMCNRNGRPPMKAHVAIPACRQAVGGFVSRLNDVCYVIGRNKRIFQTHVALVW